MTAVLQQDIGRWAVETFGAAVVEDRHERVRRVLEEAIELAQAEGLPRTKADDLVAYVYGRPVGDSPQEAAGVGVTLFVWASARGLDLLTLVRNEYDRIRDPEVMKRIRAKQAAKFLAAVGRLPDGVDV